MRRAIALPHPKQTRLYQVEIVLELGKQIALAFEEACSLKRDLVTAQDFDRLQLHEIASDRNTGR